MAMQKQKASLAAKLGNKGKKAFDAHKTDETKYDTGGDLPPNMEGVARLVECKFGEYEKGPNKGEPFLYMAGTVVEPKVFGPVKVEGRRTSIMEPICDTKTQGGKVTTIDEHFANVLNEFRKLGVDTASLGLEDLEATAEALKEEKPFFNFRTWGGPSAAYPNGRVNHVWSGLAEGFVESEDDEVEDETEEEEEAEEESEEEESEDEAEEEAEEEEDLDALAKIAEKTTPSGKAANARLAELAKEHDIDPEALDTWQDVVDAIREAQSGSDEESEDEEESEEESEEGSDEDWAELGVAAEKENAAGWTALEKIRAEMERRGLDESEYEDLSWGDLGEKLNEGLGLDEEEEEEEEEFIPKKGEVVMYKSNPKGKPVEHEVLLSIASKKTCKLKRLDDDKVFADVPWSKVTEA